MDDEATQDSAALTDFKEQNRLKIMDLLTWRKAQHERLRDEARGNYEHEANDRAYLVVLKKVRPTDRKQMLADQAADHFLRVDCHHADYASEEAIVKIVEARIAFYTPKEKQYDADGREIDEFGNLVEVDDPTKVDEATACAEMPKGRHSMVVLPLSAGWAFWGPRVYGVWIDRQSLSPEVGESRRTDRRFGFRFLRFFPRARPVA